MYHQASFQDILFVLAGIAWVAYSAYRSNANKQRNNKPDQGNNKSGFESLLDEVMAQFDDESKPDLKKNDKNIADVATPAHNESSLITDVTYFSAEDKQKEHVSEETGKVNESYIEDEVNRKARTAYNIVTQNVRKNKFDLKKAFIYSEILNRKYI